MLASCCSPEVDHRPAGQLLERQREGEVDAVVQGVGRGEGVPEQVQVLQAQPAEVAGQQGQLVVRGRQEPQLGEPAHAEGQPLELVVVQLEVDQLPELGELGGQALQAVLTEVQVLEGALQGGQAQGLAEAL